MMLGEIEGKRRRGWMRRLESIPNTMEMSLSKLGGDSEGRGNLVCFSPWGHKESDRT